MSDTCYPGLQGFPIQISGWTSEIETERAKFKIPNDISLQFSPSQVPMNYLQDQGTFQIQGTNTFFMNGTQFNVRLVRICTPKQEGLSLTRSQLPTFELHIWGMPVYTASNQKQLAVLIIPVWEGALSTSAGQAILNAKVGNKSSLESFIPQGSDLYKYTADVMRYTTCIETDTVGPMSISVAYWMNGAVIKQDELIKAFPRPFPIFGIPQLSNYKFLTRYSQTERGKGDRKFEVEKGICIPYNTSVVLTIASPEIRNGFRYIENFVNTSTTRRQVTGIDSLKCVRVDRKRDIKNGKLMIDPATGDRLEDEVKSAEDAEGIDTPETSFPIRKVMQIIFIIIGVMIGSAILAFVLYLLYYNLVTRKSLGETPTSENIEELAAALGPLAGK